MDKLGVLYFKLLTGVFALVLIGYALGRLFPGAPSYELYNTRICEVGDGITVSGFVVRSESLLYCDGSPTYLYSEGRRVSGGQVIATTEKGSLIVPQSGYLSYVTDGYEDLLNREFILGCKTEDLYALAPDPVDPYSVGKLISGQAWYFAVPGTFPDLVQGDTVTLFIEDLECEATILRTQECLVLECSDYAYRITDLRQTQAQIRYATFSGIPLPAKAIYYENENTHVYIVWGAKARAQTVSILRIQDDTIWVAPEDLPPGAQVILTEKEITDGMVLK